MIDTSKGTNFCLAWGYCRSLTSFPLLDVSNGTNFQEAWRECTLLADFPKLNVSKGVNFQNAWRRTYALKNFPSLDTSSGENFFFCWYNSGAFTEFPYLNFRKMNSGRGCFLNCSLPTGAYSKFLVDIAANNPNNNITFDGGQTSKYNDTAAPSRAALVSRGWILQDSGLDPLKYLVRGNRWNRATDSSGVL
jgi:hypothetical protein